MIRGGLVDVLCLPANCGAVHMVVIRRTRTIKKKTVNTAGGVFALKVSRLYID